MIIKANTNFIFHNVGQGLFYSGEINLSKSKFRFIYDCGSQKTGLINSAVKRFRQYTDGNEINLLILSHLHSDHTSGINELFSNFNVQNVILPYFTTKERLLIALSRLNLPTWYYEFISDPITFLIEEKEVRKVIIIGGEKGERGTSPSEMPLQPEDDFEPQINVDKLPDDKNLKKEIETNENWDDFINSGKLLIKNHNGYAFAMGVWLFRFFNYKIQPKAYKIFEQQCLDICDQHNLDLKEIIKNKKFLKLYKKYYNSISKSLNNDFNNTSLVVYHASIGKIDAYIDIHCFSCCFYFWCPRNNRIFCKNIVHDNKFGQILTGDIDLNFRYKELKKHYMEHLNNIVLTQIPHHGTYRNWNEAILNDFSNSKIWMVSAGCRNNYGHPSLKVIRSILNKRKMCAWVNEFNLIQIESLIEW